MGAAALQTYGPPLRASTFPVFRPVAVKLLQLLGNQDVSVLEVSQLLKSDPGFQHRDAHHGELRSSWKVTPNPYDRKGRRVARLGSHTEFSDKDGIRWHDSKSWWQSHSPELLEA